MKMHLSLVKKKQRVEAAMDREKAKLDETLHISAISSAFYISFFLVAVHAGGSGGRLL